VNTNATLTGTGQINSNVISSGTVSPGQSTGTLSISGTYTHKASAKLTVEIAGSTAFDKLVISGTASLSGTLNIVTNGYTPRAGETFTVLTASSLSGTFSNVSLPSIWTGLGWQVQYSANPGFVTLTVTGRAMLANYDLYASYHNLGANSDLNDPNNNGIPNLMEYALGRDPTSAAYRAATSHGRSNGWFQIQFTRNTDATNLAYHVEAATYLTGGGDWSCILSNINAGGWFGPAVDSHSESALTDGVVQVIVTDTASAATNRFLRLRVTRP
jgi:hypothetical protein